MVRLIKKDNGNYTNTNNQLVRDDDLTWKARGIFNYLWSQANEWQFYVKEIASHSKDGEKALQSGLQELEEHGYLKRVNRHSKNGSFDGLDWILDDTGRLNRQAQNSANGEMEPKPPKNRQNTPDVKRAQRETRPAQNLPLRNNNNKNYQYKEITSKRINSSADAERPDYKKEFETLWEHYPKGKKQGKQLALRSYIHWRKSHKGNTFDRAKAQLKKYLEYIKVQHVQSQYIKAAKTWFANIDDEYDLTAPLVQHNYSQYNKRVEKGTDWSKKKPKVDDSVNAEQLNDFFKKFEDKNGLN